MVDVYFFIDFSLKLLLLIVFIAISTIYLEKSRTIQSENIFFLLSMIFGTFAMIPYIIDTVQYELYQDNITRVYLNSLTFIFFSYYFYFFYRHYASISMISPSTWIHIIIIIPLLTGTFLIVLFFIHIDPPSLELIGIGPGIGTIVTYESHITFLIGILANGSALYVIFHNKLIELHKTTYIEVIAITIVIFDTIFLTINDILVTYGFYSLNSSYILVTGGLLIFSIGMILFILQNLVIMPSHILYPSLFYNNYKQLNNFFSKRYSSPSDLPNAESVSITKNENNFDKKISNYLDLINSVIINNDDNKLNIITDKDQISEKIQNIGLENEQKNPKRLTTTCIEILIYLLKSPLEIVHANEIEKDLKLKKNTLSYNLSLLESNYLIDPRKIDIRSDIRFKQVKINERGINHINTFYKYLKDYFEEDIS